MCEALRELFADDLRESREKGRNEGAAEKIIENVIKKYRKGCTAEETADMLEEEPTLVQQIYDAIEQYAPDYDVEKLYKVLQEKAVLVS